MMDFFRKSNFGDWLFYVLGPLLMLITLPSVIDGDGFTDHIFNRGQFVPVIQTFLVGLIITIGGIIRLFRSKNKLKSAKMTLSNFGTVNLLKEGQEYCWFGRVKNISPDNDVELTINVEDKDQPLTKQLKLVSDLANNYDRLMTILFDYMRATFAKTGDNKTVENLKQMYFLTAVELKKDNQDWWIVLEPLDVETIYNFFPRFTVRDMKVTWSNLG